jgi:opacity protein-like surface antigen
LNGEFSPQISLRLDYKFKQGFGPYIGASTSRSVVLYDFTDIENGMNIYSATKANMQLRLEAGYQFTTSQLFFNKAGASTNTSKTKTQSKGSCGSYSSSSCCSKKSSSSSSRCQSKQNLSRKAENKNKGWVRLQPSVGLGFIPSPKTDVITKTQGGQTTYEYRAGNWNTAFMTGMGFEFGRNKQRLLNVSVNYFSGIGNMSKQTVSGISGTKTSYANLESKASAWNMRIGIPFTLAEKRAGKHKSENKVKRTSCGERKVIEYKYRCRQ